LPKTVVVFDWLHVLRMASQAVDEVRQSIVKELDGSTEGKEVKSTRFVLLKKPEDPVPSE
jgi:hypothetical protein